MASTPRRCRQTRCRRLRLCRRLVLQALGVAQPATATRTPHCSSLCRALGGGEVQGRMAAEGKAACPFFPPSRGSRLCTVAL